MIEETATSGYDCTEEIPVMKVLISHGGDRRSRDEEVTNSGVGKRRRCGCENVSDHLNSISDQKNELVSETDIFMSVNDGFSRESSTSSVCFQSEEMESSSTSTVQNTKPPETATSTAIEATSRRKLPPVPETMPSAAELEEFFSKAEKYEQKRFAEKYNFDIVKDVPMKGRYQWILLPLPLKP